MTGFVCRVVLDYSSFYIAGHRQVEIPFSVEGRSFASNAVCINVGTRMWQDGDVTIELGEAADLAATDESPRLDCVIDTPEGFVLIFDANHPELIPYRTGTSRTRVRVWTNHDTEPDFMTVILGD